MPELFLILVAGGVMLAAAIPRPGDVSIHWLRLAGILSLCSAGLAVFFSLRRGGIEPASIWIYTATGILILAQLGFVQRTAFGVQRFCAILVFVGSIACAMIILGATVAKPQAAGMQLLGCVGVGAVCGIALMDMLLGHAYLTAAKMTIAPFRRLNMALAVALAARGALSMACVFLQLKSPIELFWPRFGLYLMTRWTVGLLVPAIFVYMAHDCIKRRSTQSATGILYVAGVLIFIGELIALYLTRETGLAL